MFFHSICGGRSKTYPDTLGFTCNISCGFGESFENIFSLEFTGLNGSENKTYPEKSLLMEKKSSLKKVALELYGILFRHAIRYLLRSISTPVTLEYSESIISCIPAPLPASIILFPASFFALYLPIISGEPEDFKTKVENNVQIGSYIYVPDISITYAKLLHQGQQFYHPF